VRWTSRALGLSSDSSYRYERGVDPHSALEAAWRAIDLICETSGGTPVGPSWVVGSDVPWAREIAVSSAYLRQRLGFDIPAAEMRAALESLELNVTRESPLAGGDLDWTVSIPSWRDDLDRPVDLVEEVLRIHGTERIPPARVASLGLAAEDDPLTAFNRRVSAYLVGHDFNECVNLTLRPGAELTTWVSQTAASELALSNPFVEDQSHLRPTLVLGLLDTLLLNQSRGVAASRLFETGRVFIEDNGQNLECAAVAFVVAEDRARRWRPREADDFFSVKRHLLEVASAAGVDLSSEAMEPVSGPGFGWQEGHAVALGSPGRGWVARAGLVSLSMLRSRGIEGSVLAGTFALLPEKLPGSQPRPRYREISLFPAALRDLALVVDSGAPAEEVRRRVEALARARAGAGFAAESVEVFDLYQGKGLPEGKKGLGFSLVFRSATRTLTDDEVNAVLLAIQSDIEAGGAYQIRK
jgi:phenylalanyl-tRNA synthetase beta chain